MLSARLVRLVEDHAAGLAKEVLQELRAGPRTPAFHVLPPDELERRLMGLHRNLGQWLKERSQPKVAAFYEELGHRRCREGVPLSEMTLAFAAIKRRLRRHVLATAAPATAMELYQLEEFEALVDGFFDEAVYHTVRGYETAVGAGVPAATAVKGG